MNPNSFPTQLATIHWRPTSVPAKNNRPTITPCLLKCPARFWSSFWSRSRSCGEVIGSLLSSPKTEEGEASIVQQLGRTPLVWRPRPVGPVRDWRRAEQLYLPRGDSWAPRTSYEHTTILWNCPSNVASSPKVECFQASHTGILGDSQQEAKKPAPGQEKHTHRI